MAPLQRIRGMFSYNICVSERSGESKRFKSTALNSVLSIYVEYFSHSSLVSLAVDMFYSNDFFCVCSWVFGRMYRTDGHIVLHATRHMYFHWFVCVSVCLRHGHQFQFICMLPYWLLFNQTAAKRPYSYQADKIKWKKYLKIDENSNDRKLSLGLSFSSDTDRCVRLADSWVLLLPVEMSVSTQLART